MPRSVQQSIPIDRIYADGVWQSGNVFSLMWQISDINYAMQSDAAKQNILTQLGTVYAGIPADCWMQVCIVSQRMDTDFLAGSFVVCGNGGEDFISLTDRQVFLYERLYHNPVVFLPTPHGLLPMKCTPEQYEQFQRDGNKLKIKPIDHGDR